LYSALSGGSQQQPATALLYKIKQLEFQIKPSSGHPLSMNLGIGLVPASPSALTTEIRELTASFTQLSARQDNV